MDYKKKKKELEEQFTKLNKEVGLLESKITNRRQEQFRLQGEYRLLEELTKKNDKSKKHKTTK